MILGSLGEFVELVKLSKKRGYYTVVCDGYKDGPAKAFADKSYCIDVRKTDEVAAVCKEEKIDGIIASFSDLLFENQLFTVLKGDVGDFQSNGHFGELQTGTAFQCRIAD